MNYRTTFDPKVPTGSFCIEQDIVSTPRSISPTPAADKDCFDSDSGEEENDSGPTGKIKFGGETERLEYYYVLDKIARINYYLSFAGAKS